MSAQLRHLALQSTEYIIVFHFLIKCYAIMNYFAVTYNKRPKFNSKVDNYNYVPHHCFMDSKHY